MNRSIRTCVRIFVECFSPTGPVYELGSFYPEGFEKLGDLRELFAGCDYVCCDLREGPGVDRVENAEALTFADRSAGTLLMFELLEHLRHPRRAVAQARRVLRDDGLLAMSVPFSYRLHGFPADYWRFTASGVHELLSDFPEKVVFAAGPAVKPSVIFAIAAMTSSPDFRHRAQVFRARIEDHFRRNRLAGHASILKERARDLFGYLLGRARLSIRFFDDTDAPPTPSPGGRGKG